MELIFILTALTLCWVTIVRPLSHFAEQKATDRYYKTYRHFQARKVQDYYPQLAQLTLREIEERYDVKEAYHRIGR